MNDVQQNQTEIAKLTPGDSFLATNGKTYMFVSYARGTIIGRLDGKGYKIPAKSFVRLVQKEADPELAKAKKEAETKQVKAREALKALGLGDMVRCNDGEVYVFIKLNKTKFLGRLGKDVFQIPIGMFVELVEKAKPDPELEAKKERIRPWFGKEIGTCYGPSVVRGFTEEETHVTLFEFGTERYDLTLDDFLSQIEEYN